MSENQDVPMPTTPPQSGAEPSTTTPPGGQDTPSQTEPTPATTESSPSPETWRAGDEAPPWARGKTADEVLGLATQMMGTLEKFNQGGSIQQNAPPPAGPPQAPSQPQPLAPAPAPALAQAPQTVELSGDDYVTGGQVQAWAADRMAQVQQANQAQFAGYAQQMAGIAKSQVREKHRAIWDKYAPEIEGHIAGMTAEAQTVDNLELVVNFVKGKHTDELIEAALRDQSAVNAEPTMRSTGGETATDDVTPRELTMSDSRVPDHWRQRAQDKGIDDAKIDEWCQLQGITKEQFYADFDRKTMTAPEAS